MSRMCNALVDHMVPESISNSKIGMHSCFTRIYTSFYNHKHQENLFIYRQLHGTIVIKIRRWSPTTANILLEI